MGIVVIREAMFYEKLEADKVQCGLCAHRCKIAPGKRGFCRVRENRGGNLYSLIYGTVSSEAVDPIEKKPLYHFYPGSYAYSVGTVGCNFRCKHCQNWTISQTCVEDSYARDILPEELVERALISGSRSIAWTYNEPTIWHEYTYESAKLAKDAGLATVYVTNGYMTPEALRHIAPRLDAANIDIKAFTEKFYHDVASAKLAPVLESSVLAKELGIHVEITNLIIPKHNDSPDELRELSKWVYKNLGPDTPLHFTRFQPQYQMQDLSPTPVKTLVTARRIAQEEGMKYVYVGNVPGSDSNNTFCPNCGKTLITRGFFEIEKYEITPEKTCPVCGENIPIIGEYAGSKQVFHETEE
ncbi:pyruvate formate-lyase 1-activating enzyme [Methanosarcina lacustris Z-7289]|uniref:Pyruvate formate-lyase 1-activating enzyme n=1 Tax=Methanosarcina lacustris Z-7289 TaxID=1434111 RepID=A0A0E3S1U6_9EURY|nr:AmmeMemoRadiSam system radical SAM enzyme [Methanosarcina lacustris]AKB74684.1 pyruvate formate-lyase 1-activating enzyme [Methanosarcina lacustris Z-7289]